MSGLLLIAAWAWPLALAAVAHRPGFWWSPMVGVIPALLVLAVLPTESAPFVIPWMLFGATFALDTLGWAFLAFSSLLWAVTSVFVSDRQRWGPRAGRLRVFFLLAMGGNLMLILAADGISFFVGFALMGLAAYGLVAHQGGEQRRRAGRLYLAWTIVGEVALFSGLVLAAHQAAGHLGLAALAAGAAESQLAFLLILMGFGIKAALPGLHPWLPVTYGHAPSATAAILSSAMIKAGLLGWLRFLPLGGEPLPIWGETLVWLGLIAVFGASLIGLTQRLPGAILGYSSIAKMGILVLGLGLILIDPALAPAGILALTLFAAHHALVKGGLFLGVELRRNLPRPSRVAPLVPIGLLGLALALSDAPWSSGALAKHQLEPLLTSGDWAWLKSALTWATVGTLLLMARLLWVLWRLPASETTTSPAGLWAWGLLLVVIIGFPFVLGEGQDWSGTAWPLAIGIAIAIPFALLAWWRPHWTRGLIGLIPPGDILVVARPLRRLVARRLGPVRGLWNRARAAGIGLLQRIRPSPSDTNRDPERALRDWAMVGVLWLGIIALLAILLLAQ